jgi:DNA anti-recombination protein RmuC
MLWVGKELQTDARKSPFFERGIERDFATAAYQASNREKAMSSIKEIKESVGVKLDKLDARADAFQAALAGSKNQMDERIQLNKQQVRRVLDRLTTDIDQQQDLPDERKQAIRSLVDNLNEQIASSQTAAHETLAYTRRQIQEGLRKMEIEVDTALAESKAVPIEPLRVSIGAYARAVDKLDAELEASELGFSSLRDKVDAALERRRKATAQNIAELKQRLDERKARADEQLASFEKELGEKLEQLAKAFKDLFS